MLHFSLAAQRNASGCLHKPGHAAVASRPHVACSSASAANRRPFCPAWKKLHPSGLSNSRNVGFQSKGDVRRGNVKARSFVTELMGQAAEAESVLSSIGVLAAVVAVHELGHFMAARLQNIHVSRFSIGFGPALWKFQGPEVEYAIRAFPLGGYVAFPDDDPQSKFPADDPDLLKNRPLQQRALVTAAGVIANFLFAWTILFTQVETLGRIETQYEPGVRVSSVVQRSVAASAGLKVGDILLTVDGNRIAPEGASVPRVVQAIKSHADKRLVFGVVRAGQAMEIAVVPEPSESDGSGRIGCQLASNFHIDHVRPTNLAAGVGMANSELFRLTKSVTDALSQVFTNFSQVANRVSGPVAMVAAGSEVARADSAGLYQFAAIVNINLGVVNLLPLPALDGGYLLLIAVEGIRSKKLPKRVEEAVMASGLLFLTALGLGLVVRDTLNLMQ